MATDTILVADDDRVVVEILSLGLRARGFAVTVAGDAMQVIMAVRKTPPAAILLDIVMPGGTGFEALKRLRSNSSTHGIPVVAMSASTDPDLPPKARELGSNAFLLKPVQLDEVAATLRQVIAEDAKLTAPDTDRSRRSAMLSDPATPEGAPSPAGADSASADQSSAARVWEQFRHVIFERLTAVEAAVTALRRATLTPEIRQKATLEAHRLAGSLGMFGLVEGSRVAREIEHLLAEEAVLEPGTPRRLVDLARSLRNELERGPA